MTLIAAYRCGTHAVICADTQETHGQFKADVNKIALHESGGTKWAMAGAGPTPLLATCEDTIAKAIRSRDPESSEDIQETLQAALVSFHEGGAFRSYPGKADDKYIAGVVCVLRPDVRLFQFFATALQPIETFRLVGEDHSQYHSLASRMYRADLSVPQGIIAGLHVLTLAKSTSTYVGGTGGASVLVATPHGFWRESDGATKELEDRLRSYVSTLDSLMLMCPDTSRTTEEVLAELEKAKSEILAIRKQAFLSSAKRALEDAPSIPYPRVPIGSLVITDDHGAVEAAEGTPGLWSGLHVLMLKLTQDCVARFSDAVLTAKSEGRISGEESKRVHRVLVDVFSLHRDATAAFLRHDETSTHDSQRLLANMAEKLNQLRTSCTGTPTEAIWLAVFGEPGDPSVDLAGLSVALGRGGLLRLVDVPEALGNGKRDTEPA